MVKGIPSCMFCYKFYLIIQKIKVKFLIGENRYMCGYCKLYEYLALNVISRFKFVSIKPIGDLNNFSYKQNLKHNIHM